MDNTRYEFRAYHTEAKEMLYGTPKQVFSWLEEGQPIIIQQWTGLKDKNGKFIFERDILFVPYNYIGKQEVKYEKGKYNICHYNLSSCEIVGNIFENSIK